MKVVSLVCNQCGAVLDNISISDGRADCYCQFCGNRILFSDENVKTVIHKTVDEARLKELEIKEMFIRQQLEEERKAKERQSIYLEEDYDEYIKTRDHLKKVKNFLKKWGCATLFFLIAGAITGGLLKAIYMIFGYVFVIVGIYYLIRKSINKNKRVY